VQPDGGVGLAATVVIDGGVVRLLLVPAFIGDLGWKPCPSGQGGNLA
jgi:uncharacterized membrane protein YdfJ with MMPL/SSD domain